MHGSPFVLSNHSRIPFVPLRRSITKLPMVLLEMLKLKVPLMVMTSALLEIWIPKSGNHLCHAMTAWTTSFGAKQPLHYHCMLFITLVHRCHTLTWICKVPVGITVCSLGQ